MQQLTERDLLSVAAFGEKLAAGALFQGRQQTEDCIPSVLSQTLFADTLVAWLHKMGLWQWQFSDLCLCSNVLPKNLNKQLDIKELGICVCVNL